MQLFRVNQAIYSSVVSAHMQMFNGAWTANCFNKTSRCIYNSDRHAQVRWHPDNMPEVLVSTVGMFSQQLPGQLRLQAWSGAATPRRDGYKRTRMGAGTYYPICQCARFGGCMDSLLLRSWHGLLLIFCPNDAFHRQLPGGTTHE